MPRDDRTHLARTLVLLLAAAVAACSGDATPAYQGYVEAEYVHVAAPVGGRLERLFVERGQGVAAGAALFQLEAVEETAARQHADEQLKAAEAQLADLRLGRRRPELDVVRAQLAQAQAAEAQALQQVRRDEAQFDAVVEDAKAVEEAGAFSVVVEGVAAPLADRITHAIGIPTIGIGASANCDGQILVLHDLLGLTSGHVPRFA